MTEALAAENLINENEKKRSSKESISFENRKPAAAMA